MTMRPAWRVLATALVVAVACAPGKKGTATTRSDPANSPSAPPTDIPTETQPLSPVPSAPGPSPTARPSPSVTLGVSVYQSRGDAAVEKVPANRTFRSGDRIRFGVLASHDGRLVLVHKGSSGSMAPIYPDQRIAEGSNTISGGAEIVIPEKGWFVFDDKPGTETVYAVFSIGEDALLKKVEDAVHAPGRSTHAPEPRLISELDARGRGAAGAPPDATKTSIVRTIVLKHR